MHIDLGADAPDYVLTGDNLAVLPDLPDGAFTLIYLDPPFNTGRAQVRRSMQTPALVDRHADRLPRAEL